MIRILYLIVYFFMLHFLRAQPEYVTTIHPFAEIIRQITDKRGIVYEILPPGASPHTYELKGSDLRKVENAAALILSSPALDNWAYKFNNPHKIELVKLIPEDHLLPLIIHFGKNKGKSLGNDPHFWTDPLTVKIVVPELAERLCRVDTVGCNVYKKNSQIFSNHLDSLYNIINEKLSFIDNKTVLLSHPFFQYFLKRFNFDMVGIIEIASGIEPTPKELKEIIDLVKDKKVKAILRHSQHSDRASQIIAESTGIKIIALDPLGGVLDRNSYDEILLFNTNKIIEALR